MTSIFAMAPLEFTRARNLPSVSMGADPITLSSSSMMRPVNS